MGSWLSSGVIEQQGWNKLTFWAALGLFAVGLIGNIVHDEVLLSIRRNAQKGDTEQEKSSGPKYGVPHGYLYRFISCVASETSHINLLIFYIRQVSELLLRVDGVDGICGSCERGVELVHAIIPDSSMALRRQ